MTDLQFIALPALCLFLVRMAVVTSVVLLVAWLCVARCGRSAAIRNGLWFAAVLACYIAPIFVAFAPVLVVSTAAPEPVALTTVAPAEEAFASPEPTARPELPTWEAAPVVAESPVLSPSRPFDVPRGPESSLKTLRSGEATLPNSPASAAAPEDWLAGRWHRFTERWGGVIAGTWFVVLIALATRLVLALRATGWLCQGSTRFESKTALAALAALRGELRISRPIDLKLCETIDVPMLAGIVRPCLLLPKQAGEWTPARMRAVLRHELGHVARHDLFSQLVADFAVAVWWFQPLLWHAARRLRVEREFACDDVVLQSGASPCDYADELLAIAAHAAQDHASSPALVAMAGRTTVEQRIRAILNPSVDRIPWNRRRMATSAAAVLLLLSVIAPLTPTISKTGHSAEPRGISDAISAEEAGAAPEEWVTTVDVRDVPLRDGRQAEVAPADEVAAKDNARPGAESKPQPTEFVTGVVVSPAGQPYVDFKVEVFRQSGAPAAEFTSGDRGEFRIPAAWFRDPLFAGEIYNCIARDAEGGLGWFQVFLPRPPGPNLVEPEIPKTFRLAVLPPGRTIRGRILGNQGQPLAGVRIQVQKLNHPLNGDLFWYGFSMADELPVPAATTNNDGRYELAIPNEAQATLEALHPEWVVRRLATGAQDDLGDVTLIPSGRIAGKVVLAETGEPAPGIVVSADRRNSARARSMQRNRRGEDPDANLGTGGFSITNDEGRFEIGGLKDDTYDMYVNAGPERRDLLGPRRQGIEVKTGEVTAVDFTVQRGRRIAGRVVEADSGQPIPGRRVYVWVYGDRERRSLISSGYPKVNDRGEFEWYVLPGFAKLEVQASREESLKMIPESQLEFEIADRGTIPAAILKLRSPTPVEQRRLQPQATVMIHAPGDTLHGFAIDRSGDWLVTAGRREIKDDGDAWRSGASRGALRLFEARSGAEIAQFEGEFGGLFDVAISPDGGSLATAGRELNSANGGEVRIWDMNTRKTRTALQGHTGWVLGTAYSPDGRLLVSGSFDGTARVWELETGKELIVLKQPSTPNFLRFSGDGQMLVVGCRGGTIKLYATQGWIERRTLELKDCMLFNLDLAPDGARLAAAGAPYEPDGKSVKSDTRGLIRIWDTATGTELRSWRTDGHSSSVAFSPNGRLLADARHTTSVWNVETGEELAVVFRQVSSSEDQIRFSPDGSSLGIAGPHGLRFWDVSPLLERDR